MTMGIWRAYAGASKMVRRAKLGPKEEKTLCSDFQSKFSHCDFPPFLGVLSQNDYLNLVQCETLEDLKLHLQSTDYGNFLASESSLQVT